MGFDVHERFFFETKGILQSRGSSEPSASEDMHWLLSSLSDEDELYVMLEIIKRIISLELVRTAVFCIRDCKNLKRHNPIDNFIIAFVEESKS